MSKSKSQKRVFKARIHWSKLYWIFASLMMVGCQVPEGVLNDGVSDGSSTSQATTGDGTSSSSNSNVPGSNGGACTAGPAYSFVGDSVASITGQYVVDLIQPYAPTQNITVSSISVDLATYASSIQLDLYQGGTVANPTSGTIIGTSTVSLATNELGMPQTYAFTLGAVPLQQGQTYWIKVRFPTNNQSGTNALWFGEVPLGQGGLRWTVPQFNFGWLSFSDGTGDGDNSLSFTITGC